MDPAFEAVIGLEVHAQLLTRTKLFCGCATSFGAPPNTHVCPVCLGLPGALPVLNAHAVELATRAALALGLTVHDESIFARKNYFYPDLPKGYQISQFDRPISTKGNLAIDVDGVAKVVGITRIHMEEDAGKNLHSSGNESIVDLNRAGTPLIEIVSEPDMRSAAEAVAYLRALRDVLTFLGVNDGNLEEGSFRCDVNVSVRPIGQAEFGTRAEIKNVNSFRFVEKAIAYELARQVDLVKSGKKVVQETRGYREADESTVSLRSKEEAHDYRYFPDPDLPPLVLEPGFVERMRKTLPETPTEKRARYCAMGLTPNAAGVLTIHPRIAAFFEDALAAFGGDAKKLANFLSTEVLAGTTTAGLDATFPVTPAQIAELLKLVDAGTISGKQAKEVYAAIAGTDRSPRDVVKERGMEVISDVGALEAICKAIVDANPKQVAGYKSGKTGLFGFFVGAVMKETKGSASPAVVNDVLKKLLE